MADGAIGKVEKPATVVARTPARVDSLLIYAIVWAVMALGVRPWLLGAHYGVEGPVFEFARDRIDPLVLSRLTAASQWLSFAGVLALAAISHARFAFRNPGRTISFRELFTVPLGYAALLCVGYVTFLWTPTSVLTLMGHDSFIFVDSSYRILHGQTPHNDFPTALGAASLYLPALGALLARGYAGSVELASAGVALFLGAALALIGARRFTTAVTTVLIVVVFLVATPAMLLEPWGGNSLTQHNDEFISVNDSLTWGMFYNRWGWAALVPMFACLTPRRDQAAPSAIEIVCFAALLTFLFYLKLTYFVVGFGCALAFAFLQPMAVRTLLIGGGATAAMVLGLGLAMGNLPAYVRDILVTAQVSGGKSDTLVPIIRENLQDILLAITPLAIIAATGKGSWKDLAAGGFMLAGSVYVIMQNAQVANIVTLVCIGAYGVARVWDETDKQERITRLASMGAFLMLAASPVIDGAMKIMDQTVVARREEIRPPAQWASIPTLAGFYYPERESFLGLLENATTPEKRQEFVTMLGILGRRQELRQGEYMQTVMAGLADLRTVWKSGESVAVLDMSNPLEVLIGARPAKGAWLTMHEGRTINRKSRPDPEIMFADVDHVMIAKYTMLPSTTGLMKDLYGDWLNDHYDQVAETPYWWRWSKKKAGWGLGANH